LIKSKGTIRKLGNYLSPLFVHEATHQIQHSWSADESFIFNPYVKEDEVEAVSMQAAFTLERITSGADSTQVQDGVDTFKKQADTNFAQILNRMEPFSKYAETAKSLAQSYAQDTAGFRKTVRNVSYAHLPSNNQAFARISAAVSKELERREKLSAPARKRLEQSCDIGTPDCKAPDIITLNDVLDKRGRMSSVLLLRLKKDFSPGRQRITTAYFVASSKWHTKLANTLKQPAEAAEPTVPSPVIK